jgi:hypothetical protein
MKHLCLCRRNRRWPVRLWRLTSHDDELTSAVGGLPHLQQLPPQGIQKSRAISAVAHHGLRLFLRGGEGDLSIWLLDFGGANAKRCDSTLSFGGKAVWKKMHKNIPKTYGLCYKGLLQKFLGCYQLLYQQLGWSFGPPINTSPKLHPSHPICEWYWTNS